MRLKALAVVAVIVVVLIVVFVAWCLCRAASKADWAMTEMREETEDEEYK